MNYLSNPVVAEDIRRRIMHLHPESERLWGTMDPARTLAHCRSGMLMATGVIRPNRAPFPANVLGVLIKPLVFRDDQPMRRNSPSSPELFSAHPTACNFDDERDQLMAAIDEFVMRGTACCTQHPHPFFGRLKPEQWSILMYKHVDHHLRQFGA